MSSLAKEKIPILSKSRFMAGLQCHKRLYFECYNRDLADPVSVQQQSLFDTGTRVGILARELYSAGVLIEEDYLNHSAAVESTKTILANYKIPALYEAAFTYDDIRIRVDILVRAGSDYFDLVEIKSGTQTKEEHVPDVAVQLYVLNGCGINIRRAFLGHLNSSYVYQGGDYDLEQLFSLDDITWEAQKMQSDIPLLLTEMRAPLWRMDLPDTDIGRQCGYPYKCAFYGHCHADEPEHHISQLYRVSQGLFETLKEAGIEDIRDIPGNFEGLNTLQKRVRNCVVNNRLYQDSQLAVLLQHMDYPVHFLDFETFSPPLPLYVGTRPYQVIPFQWSDHILERNENLSHEEFLYDGAGDPRKAFTTSLLNVLGSEGSIVVYSSFEATRIRELADAFPELANELLFLEEDRIVDLLKLIRRYCYHPEFHGSFSIKSVLPALVPGMSYDDLEIKDGGMAPIAYAEMIRLDTPSDRRNFLRRSLLAYCSRDTEAEVELFKKLQGGFSPFPSLSSSRPDS